MKVLVLFLFSLSAFAQDIKLSDYNFTVEDILKQKTNKESEFKKLNRNIVKINDSICSNRAQVWSWDFHLRGIDSAKVFMFFTPKTSRQEGVNWWYHVAPIVNEKGSWWVLDGGFPDRLKKPIALDSWMKEFNGKDSKCKELTARDEDLVEKIFLARSLPSIENYHCYYKITPPGFWVPNQVAMNLLGRDREGKPVNIQRDELVENEVYTACIEASTTPFGRVLGSAKSKCRAFLRHGSQN